MRSPDSNPTYAQIEFAKKLGIDIVGKTRGQLAAEIERVDDELGTLALANPALRLNNHIVHQGGVYVITAIRDNPRRRSVSIRPVAYGGSVKVERASLLLDVQELAPELIERLSHQPRIASARFEDLFSAQHAAAGSVPAERSNTGVSPLARLIEAVQEQTAVLREISLKLDGLS